jgi:uncharacterized protein YukJ
MPVPAYGVLKGHPSSRGVNPGGAPHLHINLSVAGATFDIAVNILSQDDSEVLYSVNHAFTPPHPAELLTLPAGRTLLPAGNPLALDFIRQQLVSKDDMSLLEASDIADLKASDLHNEIDDMVARAINDPEAQFFAFGSKFPNGIHDIHMNQGNPKGLRHGQDFSKDNGTFQDGALMVYFPNDQRWLAAFIAFQSQSWTTDDKGNPTDNAGSR